MLNVVKMKFDEGSGIRIIPEDVYFSNSKLVFKLKGHESSLMPIFIKREISFNKDGKVGTTKRIICVGAFVLSSLSPITVSSFMPTFSGSLFTDNADLNMWFMDLLSHDIAIGNMSNISEYYVVLTKNTIIDDGNPALNFIIDYNTSLLSKENIIDDA